MNVVFSLATEHDLGELVSYITNDLQNPSAARNIATKVLQRSQSLASFSEMGAYLGDIDHRLGGYRYLLVDNYLLIYKVIGTEVAIIRILYARSDYMQLLQG
jgi:toxin ParE1/3/4